MAAPLTFFATASGEIRCWFLGSGQMPRAVRPQLVDLIDRTPACKIAADREIEQISRNELVDLNLAFRGARGALYLSTEGAALRRAYRDQRRRGNVRSPFAVNEGQG